MRLWGVLLILVGVPGLVASILYQRSVVEEAAGFRPAAAEITKSQLMSGKAIYWLRVRYTYTVDGKAYDGRKLRRHPGADHGGSSNLAYWEAMEERYPTGAQVTAFYNPANPAEAYLDNETMPVLHRVLIIMAALVTAVGVVMLVLTFFLRI